MFCLVSPVRGDPADRRSSAACICCVGPHHKPSSGAPDADLSARLPLTGCCGADVRGRSSAARTPRTPCTPTARRLCGVRPRTPRRGQVCCFPAATVEPAGPEAAAAVARTPQTPTTQAQQAPGWRRRWLFRSARQAAAQMTPRFRGAGRDSAHAGNNNTSAYDARLPEAEAETETCSNDEYALLCREGFSREDVAAVTIQAYFRGHLVRAWLLLHHCRAPALLRRRRVVYCTRTKNSLCCVCMQARRAFMALKSLVKLQAVARGAFVRRQAEVAMQCMQAMARLHGRVRARRMLTTKPEAEQLLQS